MILLIELSALLTIPLSTTKMLIIQSHFTDRNHCRSSAKNIFTIITKLSVSKLF
ncbi:hypothetical protein GJI78_02715 [Lactococcus lactis subsp. cremoris]|uniref:Uncharacterized protein n=1 Tax=Lactococcus lactis subsp. lactis TaxID=1360 RepID=A0A0V8DAU6_LACLL|nr:hypothetical protein CVCAS_0757 [Lactococcus lactis subsp. lactis CV56]KST79022.1 hypothetical protein E34_1107 [Lactococcus lactis subsp. lactis]KZK12837.1 hypothetical protein DRA4_0868 [Lactococcus lactis subsp. lactis bv. diacetylactis]MRL87745.1 hypothetical protein [Lactococcus cremoris]MUV46843.1 hypothetical protein [Lactococcus lactis]